MPSIIVKPINGTIRAETLNFSRIDPYLIIKYGGHKFFTSVSVSKDKYQNWEDVFKFPFSDDQEIIIFECWDYNVDNITRQSDLVGSGFLNIKQNMQNKNDKYFSWVKVFTQGEKEIGEILVELEQEKDDLNIVINFKYI